MNNEMKIREKVYKKMEQEYNTFIENLKLKPPEKIIDGAYEKVMKEEILGDFYPEYDKYDIEKIKALNKCKAPLEELYQNWMDCDTNICEILEYNIYETLENLVKKENNKLQER